MEQKLFELEKRIEVLEQNLEILLKSYKDMQPFFENFQNELKKIEGLNDNFNKIIKLINQFKANV